MGGCISDFCPCGLTFRGSASLHPGVPAGGHVASTVRSVGHMAVLICPEQLSSLTDSEMKRGGGRRANGNRENTVVPRAPGVTRGGGGGFAVAPQKHSPWAFTPPLSS